MIEPSGKLGVVEEAELLHRIQHGSTSERDAAHERLYIALRQPLYALCLQLTGNDVDADDALQESFIAAFRGLSLFRGEARISTWLYRIAVRESLRQKSRKSAREPRITKEPVAPEAPNPALRREETEELQEAFDTLSADHRTVLAMFAIEGLSHQEIATALKIPIGTVWSRLHKARKQLATKLRRELHKDPSALVPSEPRRQRLTSTLSSFRRVLVFALQPISWRTKVGSCFAAMAGLSAIRS